MHLVINLIKKNLLNLEKLMDCWFKNKKNNSPKTIKKKLYIKYSKILKQFYVL